MPAGPVAELTSGRLGKLIHIAKATAQRGSRYHQSLTDRFGPMMTLIQGDGPQRDHLRNLLYFVLDVERPPPNSRDPQTPGQHNAAWFLLWRQLLLRWLVRAAFMR